MKKFILNILLLAGVAGVGLLIAWFARNCVGGHDFGLSPEDTVKAFYSSMMEGDWEEAADLCLSTDEMETYVENFRRKWESAAEADSAAMSAVSDILSKAGMTLKDSRHEKKNRFRTLFTITTDSGMSKTKEVELMKEEGVWLVSRISVAE